jgi:hypothetical protein
LRGALFRQRRGDGVAGSLRFTASLEVDNEQLKFGSFTDSIVAGEKDVERTLKTCIRVAAGAGVVEKDRAAAGKRF